MAKATRSLFPLRVRRYLYFKLVFFFNITFQQITLALFCAGQYLFTETRVVSSTETSIIIIPQHTNCGEVMRSCTSAAGSIDRRRGAVDTVLYSDW